MFLLATIQYKTFVIYCNPSNMTSTVKRKVRRRDPTRGLNRWVVASVIGESPRVHYRFAPLDIGQSLPFLSLDRAIFVRVISHETA